MAQQIGATPIFKGKIPIIFFKEGDEVIAFSPALDLSTCGSTEKEARKKFEEATKIFLREIIQMGTLSDVLTECGWKKVKFERSWSPPTYKHELIPIPEGVC
ncbi:MAG: hypothetical protein JXA17_08815 [Dehalococcoidales bacterium]|nr:hypothetical protein [Dehalococcoidales bacterium]